MLVYFDAIDVLQRYVTGSQFPFKTIDITILVSPWTSKILLPWKDVFNSKILSNLTQDGHHVTSDFILTYFQKAVTSNISNSYALLIQAQRALKSKIEPMRKMKRVVGSLNKLSTDSTVPGWKDWAKGQLNNLKETSESFDQIADAIQLLLNSNQFKFFWFLNFLL